jgi:uncharacterized protein YraI/beta-lactamase class A
MPISARVVRATSIILLAACIALILLSSPNTAQGQNTVLAEAINEANVRVGPGIEYTAIVMIKAGTRYPVVGRSALYPWVLIQVTDTQQGWVFRDLVRIIGIEDNVPYTEVTFDLSPTQPPPTADQPTAESPTVDPNATAGVTATVSQASPPTATQANQVMIEAQGELNVRYGPGTEYPRIGILQAGERYPITRRHNQVPWVEIAYPNVAGGLGWVYIDAVRIIGNLNSVPSTSMIDFGYPALTPTHPMVVTSSAPWTATAPATLQTSLVGVSNSIYDLMLSQKFDPGTTRQGAVFVLDLQTGESISLNPDIAYSGMSLIKIPVMMSFFRKIGTSLTLEEAQRVADMIVCSENLSSNFILRLLGDGSEYRGAEYVTSTMQALGIKNTFLVGPFFVGNVAGQPTATVQPVSSPKTEANQQITDPDPFNQATPADLGWLMGSIYYCALDGSGPLMSVFPGEFTINECRQMLRMMRSNRVAALIGGGLPTDVPLARKYGWVDEVHGDAALVTTQGGSYVLVVMLRNREWLNYDESFPLIAEISRMIYNHYNPSSALPQTNSESVPACSLDTIDADLFPDLMSGDLPAIQ